MALYSFEASLGGWVAHWFDDQGCARSRFIGPEVFPPYSTEPYADPPPPKRRRSNPRPSVASQAMADLADLRAFGFAHRPAFEALRARYRELAFALHPDRNRAPDATARMALLNAAFDRLRARYSP